MKKLSIALALLLCVVICVFCFASCGKKKKADATTAAPGTTPTTTESSTTAPGTTAEPTTAPHEHTPEADYTTDKPATCGADGSKSIHCSECGNIIPGTEVKIDADPTQHVVDEWNVTKEATIFEDGVKTGTCTVCHQPVEKVIEETYNEYKFTTESTDTLDKSKNFASEILGEDKHFYPTEENPNGLDFYIEYSFLWNADLQKMSNVGDTKNQILTGCIGNQDAYFMALTTNAKGCDNKVAPGGFEYTATRTVEYGPAGMSEQTANGGKVGNTYADFPNIGGADQANPEYGWHRFALVVHEELLNEAALKADTTAKATEAEYRFSFTVYVDGVKLYTLSNRSDPAFKASSYRAENMLFTAESDGEGGVVYKDIDAGKNVTWIQIPTFQTTEGTAYAVYADEAIFAGSDFAQKVVKVVAPVDNVYTTKDGDEIPAKIWYKPFSTEHDHVYSVEVEVTKTATLLEDGTKVMKCAFCDDTKPVDYSLEPDVQKWTESSSGHYTPNRAQLGTIRGEDHFYDEGKDLLIEYSVLWNETVPDLKSGDSKPFIDARFTVVEAGNSGNKNIIYWSLADDNDGADCKFAGGFEWGGIDKNEADNPYPKFTKGALGLGTTRDEYPNIGGANGGDGTPQGEDRWGWHRVSVRYRETITNKDALIAAESAGVAATYKLEMWVYIDGVLVIHANASDLKDSTDRKLYSASSNGNGGIAYVENDELWLNGAFTNSKKAKSGKTVYFAIADYSATIGTDFVQNVVRIDYPVEAQLEVEDGVFVTSTMWYTKPCAEHTWDGEFTVIEEATLLNDGLKVEHCSVCGMSHEVVLAAAEAPVITDSKNIAASKYADNGNKDVAALKSVADIRGEKSFAPTADDDDGNDLWFEYSFLYNDTLQYRDATKYLAEMRLFGFRSADYSKYRGFYYIYFLNNKDEIDYGGSFKTSNDCPYAGHIDYSTYKSDSLGKNNAIDLTSEGNTLNGDPIGQYVAGWGSSPKQRSYSPYLWDSEKQAMGGWHRLGFRYHQEAEILDGEVRYSGYTELYIDGVKVWKVLTNTEGKKKSNGTWEETSWSLKGNNLLLWTAEIDPEDNTKLIYTHNDTMLVGMRIDRLDTSSQSVYVGIDDVQWNCGDGFVHPVVRVENPKPVKFTVAEGVEVDGAMYYAYAHVHDWDEDYTVTKEATLLEDGEKIDHCKICGETRTTVTTDEQVVCLTSWDTDTKNASQYALNDEDYGSKVQPSFGIKKSVKNVRGEDHFYPTAENLTGNDLLVEFSFLYNESMANLGGESQVLTVMFIENYNLFNINLKTGKITARMRAANEGGPDAYIFPTQAAIDADASLKSVDIGDYGWHRFGVRIHEDAVNNAGTVEYTVIASAYLDGEKIFEIDKTTWVLSKCSDKVEGKLFSATVSGDNLVYDEVTGSTVCDVYLMSQLFFDENTSKDIYLVFTDFSVTCGKDFVQDVKPVADPAAQTYVVTEGVEFSGKIWYEYDK